MITPMKTLKAVAVGGFLGAGLALTIGAVIQAEYVGKMEITNTPLSIFAASPVPIREPVLTTPNTNLWSYFVQTINPDTEDSINQILKARGNEGWELVGMRTNQFIFKKAVVGLPPG